MRQRRMMVIEIPVFPVGEADIRLQSDEYSAGTQHPQHFGQHVVERGLGRQMLEKVAREAYIDVTVAEKTQVGRGTHMKLDVPRQALLRRGLEIHRYLSPRADVPNELAVPATEVEHCVVLADEALKVAAAQHRPDPI